MVCDTKKNKTRKYRVLECCYILNNSLLMKSHKELSANRQQTEAARFPTEWLTFFGLYGLTVVYPNEEMLDL